MLPPPPPTSPRPLRSLSPVLLAGLLLGLLTGALARTADAQTRALPHAHAHNDYLHERPLIDALRHGFTSVEADVHLVNGELLVAHDRSETRPGRTLEALYLRPLRHWIRAHDGVVHLDRTTDAGDGGTAASDEGVFPASGEGASTSHSGKLPNPGTLTLLIDVKSEAVPTYRAIHRALRAYADLFTIFAADTVDPGPVTAVISGNRARELIASQPIRYAAVDGRPPDLSADPPPPVHLVPLVSTSWSTITDWRGAGPMPEEDRRRMRQMVERAHAQGRRIRFWATGDRPAVWEAELKAGVDLLNADDLGMLREFLLERAVDPSGPGEAVEAGD